MRPSRRRAVPVLAAALLAAVRAFAQCDAGDAGSDPAGTLLASFPGDGAADVPTDSPVRLRFAGSVPTAATVCLSQVGTSGCIAGSLRVDRDELWWLPAEPLVPGHAYVIGYSDPLGGAVSLGFRTGAGPSAGPPRFAGITDVSSRSAGSDGCDPGAVDVTVRFNRAVAAPGGAAWPESDVEYVVFETRGPGVGGPVERDRARLESSGSAVDPVAQRTFRLGGAQVSGPVCFSIQALDPLGRVAANGAESCVDPAQGNYFRGCSASPRGSAGAVGWPLAALGAWCVARRRRRSEAA